MPNTVPSLSKWAKSRAKNPEYRVREALRKRKKREEKTRAKQGLLLSKDYTPLNLVATRNTGSSADELSTIHPVERPILPPISSILNDSTYQRHALAQMFLSQVKYDVWLWTKEWESVEFFGYYISNAWQSACQEGESAVVDWLQKMNGKLVTGRKIVERLRDVMPSDSPLDLDQTRDLWRQAYDLLSQVHHGLALLEVWLKLTNIQ